MPRLNGEINYKNLVPIIRDLQKAKQAIMGLEKIEMCLGFAASKHIREAIEGVIKESSEELAGLFKTN